jgi:uncharacterized protein (TIGR03083 family)
MTTRESSVEANIQLVRALSNEMAAFLRTLPEEVWRDAERYASACERWTMADVVTHVIDGANEYALSVRRALAGSVAPPLGHRALSADEQIEQVVALRTAFDEDLFPEFNASCLRLNRMLVELTPAQRRLPVWRPAGALRVSQIIEHRVVELAVHAWDVRYGIDRSAALSPLAVPFLKAYLGTWLKRGFRQPEGLETPIRFRYLSNDAEGEGLDLVVTGDGFSLCPADSQVADVTFTCDTDSLLLLLMGRLPLRRSVRRGRIVLEGDVDLAARFDEWFWPT